MPPKGLWNQLDTLPFRFPRKQGGSPEIAVQTSVGFSLNSGSLGLLWQIKGKGFLEIEIYFGQAQNLPKLIFFFFVRLVQLVNFLNLPSSLFHMGKMDETGREDYIDAQMFLNENVWK